MLLAHLRTMLRLPVNEQDLCPLSLKKGTTCPREPKCGTGEGAERTPGLFNCYFSTVWRY